MIEDFGQLPDGAPVQRISLRKGSLEASVLTFGAIIQDLQFNGQRVVLGYSDLAGYLSDQNYMGAVVGRCANRVSGGVAVIDGKAHQLTLNCDNRDHLHGGTTGFSARNWSIEQHDKASVLLKMVSEDGDEGYPGRAEVLLRYTLTGGGALRVKMTATTDKATLVNLTQHSYFNLDGSATIADHSLEVAAERYLPLSDDLVPTGDVRNVAWTAFDFQDGRKIGASQAHDLNYCLADKPRDSVEFAAALEDAAGDMRMEVWTTEPGLQLYDGGQMQGSSIGHGGAPYGPKAGVCLEAQRWPDGINNEGFPNVVLRPGETYTHISEFRFS